MDGYNGLYQRGKTTLGHFNQFAPDHGFNHTPAETGVKPYELQNKRGGVSMVTGGAYTQDRDATATVIGLTETPLLVWDYSTQGVSSAASDVYKRQVIMDYIRVAKQHLDISINLHQTTDSIIHQQKQALNLSLIHI